MGMRINDLLPRSFQHQELHLLRECCQQFIRESNGFPLIKNLSTNYNDVHKIKVRQRKSSNKFAQTFNNAFESYHYNLRQRAIFANGLSSFNQSTLISEEPFYIFPIDGYNYMYSKEVEQSDSEYKAVFESIFEQFGSEHGEEVLSELLRFTYTSTNLEEGIERGSEIILYNIPFYYAVRASSYKNYATLWTSITRLV